MYSGTVKKSDLDFAALQRVVPDIKKEELRLPCGMTVLGFPTEAPWLGPFGACLINITNIRRNDDGLIEFQVGDEHGVPYDDGSAWFPAIRFYEEWPD